MCNKAVDTCRFALDSVSNQYMVQEMCDKVVYKEPFMLKYCPDRCKTPKICNKAVNFCLQALIFFPDWFVVNKMIGELDNANDDIIFGDIDFDIVTFFVNDIGLNSINLNNVNIDDDKFGNNDPETINHVRFMTWFNRYKQHQTCELKIDEVLMPAA